MPDQSLTKRGTPRIRNPGAGPKRKADKGERKFTRFVLYLPPDLTDFVDERGGNNYLLKLIQAAHTESLIV